ncbi:MAG: proline dehydrogenase family protein, partial [Pseudoclavibacter sp.]
MLEPSRSEIDLALADEAIALVRTWLDESRSEPVDAAARRLAGVLRDPDGLDFALGFVDEVIRPEDRRVSAAALRRLAPKAPRFLGAPLRGLIQLGGAASFVAPGIVVPVAQTALRWMVRHLVVDASDRKLTSAIRRLRADDVRLNVNLLGEAILGDAEAKRRLEATTRLVERDDVDYVSIKVSSTVSPHTHWSFDEAVEHAVDALTPLYRRAKARGTFVNLDMEEYK